jgi:hypothetical protein
MCEYKMVALIVFQEGFMNKLLGQFYINIQNCGYDTKPLGLKGCFGILNLHEQRLYSIEYIHLQWNNFVAAH